MLTRQSWRKLSQATATTVLGVAIVAGFGTSKASAVNLQTFKISGTFGDKSFETGSSDSQLVNGSVNGTFTLDLDKLPVQHSSSVAFEDWNVDVQTASGIIRHTFYPRILSSGFLSSDIVGFSTRGNPNSRLGNLLLLFINSDLTPRGLDQGLGVPIYGSYSPVGSGPGGNLLTSVSYEPVPEPLTLGGTAVAGVMGLWFKRKKQA